MSNFDDLFSLRPDQTEVPFDKDAWAAKKQADRENAYARIDSYAAKMGTNGEVYRTYLDVQSRFAQYSVSNAILIAAQQPKATKLADFSEWKRSGVYIKRGAEAIILLVPGREYQRDDGSIGVSYSVKRVFDISQTSSRQRVIPPAPRSERMRLRALIHNIPCRFAISDALPEGVNATYHAQDNTILVRQGLDAPVLFQSLAQEAAYVYLTNGSYPCQAPAFLAHSASYMLCKRSGISVERFSFSSLPEQYGVMDAQRMRGEMGILREVSGRITMDMDRFFATQERKGRDDAAR